MTRMLRIYADFLKQDPNNRSKTSVKIRLNPRHPRSSALGCFTVSRTICRRDTQTENIVEIFDFLDENYELRPTTESV